MQIVIDIPEDVKHRFTSGVTRVDDMLILAEALIDCIPLPKGHGCLIDQDALIGKIHGVRSITAVLDAPVIIEADRGDVK